MEPKTKEGRNAKAGPYSGGRLADWGPGYRPRNSLTLVDSATALIGSGSAISIIPKRTL